MRHDHPELGRDYVEPLGHVLADHMHGYPAARAMGVLGLDGHVHARQMAGERAAIDAALGGALARPCRIPLVVVGFARRNGLLDILKRQCELVCVEFLRPPAKLHAPQLLQEMLQAVILRQRLVALSNGGIARRNRGIPLRAQYRDQACSA